MILNNYIWKYRISKQCHIHSYQILGLEHIFLGFTIQPIACRYNFPEKDSEMQLESLMESLLNQKMVGSEGSRIGQRGNLNCDAVTTVTSVIWETLEERYSYRNTPHYSKRNRSSNTLIKQSLHMSHPWGWHLTLSKAVLYKHKQFPKKTLADNYQPATPAAAREMSVSVLKQVWTEVLE